MRSSMPPTDDVERFLADGPPGEPLEERRVFAELHDALFGGQTSPVTLSRYVVLERIAAGGLGVVYAGFDPQLDRKVAIKLLHARPRGAPVAETHARLLREARTLAQLTHPNVVAVHDVGTYDEQEVAALTGVTAEESGNRGVFVVMELVVGLDLGHWLTAEPRSWREVLEVFIQAGEGLAAAHAAGIVHRDFKPANVIVGEDRRARVLDFGLARALAPATPPEVELEPTRPRGSPRLTHSGAVLGTPAYMAPEQHAGRPSDERTDGFAFFAALYEAVYGQLPFPESDLAQLAKDKKAGRIAAPPRGRSCPAALHRAVVRGLSPAPAERFGSMQDALVELRRVQRGWRRHLPWMLAAGTSAVAVAAFVRTPAPDPCAPNPEALAGIWDDDVRREIHEGLLATAVPFAASTVASVERSLDAYAESITAARSEACLAARDAEPAIALSTQRCLDRRRARLRALTRLLRTPDAELAERAVDAASSLPSVSVCTLAHDASTEETTALDAQLADAEALRDAGRFRDGLAIARRAVDAAERQDDPAATSRALRVLGSLRTASGDAEGAEDALEHAWLTAERVGLMDAAAGALVDLVGVLVSSAQYAEGDRLAALARARLSYRGNRDELDARLALEVARLRLAQGRTDDAVDTLADALRLSLDVWGEGHPRVADVLNERGNLLDRQGRYAEAMDDYTRALQIRQAILGPAHPRVGASLNNIGNIHASLGRHTEALHSYERALSIYEDALGPQHPRVAAVVNNLAIVHDQLGQTATALAEHRRALAIREQTLPEDHPHLALDHNNIGSVLARLGHPEDALTEYERALEIRERRLGPAHPDVAHTLDNIAVTLGQLGRTDEAIAKARRALEIRQSALEPEHPDLATSLVHLAGLLQRAGRQEEARPLAKRALAIRRSVLGAEHPSTTEAAGLVEALADSRNSGAGPVLQQRPL